MVSKALSTDLGRSLIGGPFYRESEHLKYISWWCRSLGSRNNEKIHCRKILVIQHAEESLQFREKVWRQSKANPNPKVKDYTMFPGFRPFWNLRNRLCRTMQRNFFWRQTSPHRSRSPYWMAICIHISGAYCEGGPQFRITGNNWSDWSP